MVTPTARRKAKEAKYAGRRAANSRYVDWLARAGLAARGIMSRPTRGMVVALGWVGGVARGIVFGAAGLFLLIAAVTARAHQAKGIDAALRAFTKTPAGPWLLVLVALGLVTFGCYSLAEARWRRR